MGLMRWVTSHSLLIRMKSAVGAGQEVLSWLAQRPEVHWVAPRVASKLHNWQARPLLPRPLVRAAGPPHRTRSTPGYPDMPASSPAESAALFQQGRSFVGTADADGGLADVVSTQGCRCGMQPAAFRLGSVATLVAGHGGRSVAQAKPQTRPRDQAWARTCTHHGRELLADTHLLPAYVRRSEMLRRSARV